MTKKEEIITVLTREEMFENECQIINLKYEYPGYTGEESFGIVTSLSPIEVKTKFSDLLIPFCPYIVLDYSFKEIRDNFQRNEKKHYARLGRGNAFDFDEEFEEHHPEFAKDDCETEVIRCFSAEMLYNLISNLKENNRKYLLMYYFDGMSYSQIAIAEKTSKSNVCETIKRALKKCKQCYQSEYGVSSYLDA